MVAEALANFTFVLDWIDENAASTITSMFRLSFLLSSIVCFHTR